MLDNIYLMFLVAALVVYRISRMVALEEGPFDLFTNLRGFLWERFSANWVRAGLACPLCISFWVSPLAAAALYFQLHLAWYEFFWLWLGLSGAASFLYRMEQ